MCATVYDGTKVSDIMDNKSFTFEDVSFLKKRATMLKRILTQSNTFLETYKLFNDLFTFKKMPLRDYINIMAERTKKALQQTEDLRKKNPEKAAQEDDKAKKEKIKQHEEYIKRRIAISVVE